MPLHRLRVSMDRIRQKRKAIQMLALSGVVRPSHVELRYATQFLNSEGQSSAAQEKPVPAVRSLNFLRKFFDLMSGPTKDNRSLGQHLLSNNRLRLSRSLSMSMRSLL